MSAKSDLGQGVLDFKMDFFKVIRLVKVSKKNITNSLVLGSIKRSGSHIFYLYHSYLYGH